MRFLLWPQKNQAFLGTFLGPPSRDSDVMAAKCKPSPWIRKCAVERVQRSDDFPWTEEDCPSKKRSNTAYPFLRQGSHTVPAWRFTWQLHSSMAHPCAVCSQGAASQHAPGGLCQSAQGNTNVPASPLPSGKRKKLRCSVTTVGSLKQERGKLRCIKYSPSDPHGIQTPVHS